MRKISLFALLITAGVSRTMAQDQVIEKKEKIFEHHVAVQVNQLIRQVLNFSNSTSSATNPYLLDYSINSIKKGWGMHVGLGYVFSSVANDDGINKTDNKINDLSARVGVEKKFSLSEKWSAGAGLDLVYATNDDHTQTIINSSFGGGESTDTKTKISSYGAGPRGWLRYNISKRITLGTEVSFYYTQDDHKSTIVIIDQFGNVLTTPVINNDKRTQANINLPVAFFLGVQF